MLKSERVVFMKTACADYICSLCNVQIVKGNLTVAWGRASEPGTKHAFHVHPECYGEMGKEASLLEF